MSLASSAVFTGWANERNLLIFSLYMPSEGSFSVLKKSLIPQNYNESANIANSRAAIRRLSVCGSDERRKI